MELLQWHIIYKFGEDELHRLPVVALNLIEKFKDTILHLKRDCNHYNCDTVSGADAGIFRGRGEKYLGQITRTTSAPPGALSP